MRMLYKDMFNATDAGIPDTRVSSVVFTQQGASFDDRPPSPKFSQQNSLMSTPDDWPDVLFTPSVVRGVQEAIEAPSVSVSVSTRGSVEKTGERAAKEGEDVNGLRC